MEIYGTRQTGEPSKCPQSCEIRDRRILHGVGEKVPPHCSSQGSFSPVQCKLVNTTDKMVVDVVSGFSRFPGAFNSFNSLRETFPEISGYCYCADSLGRELTDTGLELLLGEVYEAEESPGRYLPRSFTETSLYRILQRRFLGVQLITSGKFRCPSQCEVQRYAASQMADVYIPSCTDDGNYEAVQCQLGGQCWCVDSNGREIYGSRVQGNVPNCNNYEDCPTRRRQALSRLFFGPTGHFGKNSLFITQEDELGVKINTRHCPSYIVEAYINSGLLSSIDEKLRSIKLKNFISDMISGLFPSKDLIKQTLRFKSDVTTFEQNLFGGKHLNNVGAFNFTGTVGSKSKFNFSDFFQQIGLTETYSGGNFRELAKVFSSEEDSYFTKESSKFSRLSINLNQVIRGSFGRAVNLKENQNLVTLFASILDQEEFTALLSKVGSFPPEISQDVVEAVQIIMKSKDCEKGSLDGFVPTCTGDGRYNEIQCSRSECWCVDNQGKEIEGSRTQDEQPRCPMKCEKEREQQKLVKQSLPAGSEPYIPACDQKGNYFPVQCSGKECFCVDLDGRVIPGTQALSGKNIQCPSNCQLTASRAFLQTAKLLLSGALSRLSQVYVPQCTRNGSWRPVQCTGPTEQALELYKIWTTQNDNISYPETLRLILNYKNTSSRSFSAFVRLLYSSGHQNAFPFFTQYPVFNDVPEYVLGGNITEATDNVLLNPYVFWRILTDSLSFYPGSYGDFSVVLGHFELRNCWCVDLVGQKLQETESKNKAPKCPGTCELAKLRTSQFIGYAEDLMAASNASRAPLGQGFLLANGIRLTERDLFFNDSFFESGISFSESLMSRDSYVLQLAAQSTLRFYWQRRFGARRSSRGAKRLAYVPYVPQCDGSGNWIPTQTYQSTGHSWCVDEDGNYVSNSLVSRPSSPLQCQTPCRRTQTNAQVASWVPRIADSDLRSGSTFLITNCTEAGENSAVQNSDTNGSCVLPPSNDPILQDASRLNGNTGCPVCPLPFRAQNIKQGVVFCEGIREGERRLQSCQVMCRKGYYNALPSEILTCDVSSLRWVSQPPHLQSCQRVQSFHIAQTELSFHLLLPSSKTCKADYSGLLQSFRTFILDDLKARGLCHVQVNYFGSRGLGTVPVCDDSTVYVECLSKDRLGVNVTWKAQLDDLQIANLPGLHDIEAAVAGENLVGRFLSILRSGNYALTLDSQHFVADRSAFFLRDEDSNGFPQVQLGCKDGFQKLEASNPDRGDVGGCVICPEGSYGQVGLCRLCPVGHYQEDAGQTSCVKCPPRTSTAYSGASSKTQCMTGCQMDTSGLLCAENGQYRPAQKDVTANTYFCTDLYGEKMNWTERDSEVTQDQCSLLRKFDLVPEDELIYSTEEDSGVERNKQISGSERQLLDCFKDCAVEDSCDYLAVSTNGSQVACEQYSGDQSNVLCTTTKQVQGYLGNSAAVDVEHLDCKLKVKLSSKIGLAVYRKRGQEFIRTGQTTFEKTDFGNTVGGVYNTTVFSASDTSLADAHLFCRQRCTVDPCCRSFILSQIILNKGTILCGLLGTPNVLLCNTNDWSSTSNLGGFGVCKGVKSNTEAKKFSFYLGGQEFTGSYEMLSKSIGKVEYNTELTAEVKEEIQQQFVTFQSVFLLTDPDKKIVDPQCGSKSPEGTQEAVESEVVMDRFLPVDTNKVKVDEDISLASQQYQIAKQRYSSKQAVLWCLTRCVEEESWCRLADLQDTDRGLYTCIIYPYSWTCSNTTSLVPDRCDMTLKVKPQLLYRKKEILGNKVKHFYIYMPYRKVTRITARNRIPMTGKAVAKSFFECELQCDADPCCKGFGFLQRSPSTGMEFLCLTLRSLGIQSCGRNETSTWSVTDCSFTNEETAIHPFGWYQKPEVKETLTAELCPPSDPIPVLKGVSLDNWIRLDTSSVTTDSTLSKYQVIQINGFSSEILRIAQNNCLAVCTGVPSCMTTTIEVQQAKIRCIFYPETKSCSYNLKKHNCHVLIKEPATYIYRKKVPSHPLPSVNISSQASLYGKTQVVQVGSDIKYVNQYLGVPYAAPPVGDYRFRPPQPYNLTGTWNASSARPTCLQPGDGKAQYSSVSEDCLYLNVFVPTSISGNASILLYFHNSPSDYSENGQTFIDGSFQAVIGDIIVVTAGYRTGVFGFLSTGNATPNGNWGLLDQASALKWVQENIAYFGGDPGMISVAADRAGADIASLHLINPELKMIRRALLMGGSAFNPMLFTSKRRAREQINYLAAEVGCLSPNDEDTLTCLRKADALTLNAAQTKLLALRGPFQTWGPAVDGVYVRDTPSRLIQQRTSQNIELLIGNAEQDGLIVRAKAIKRFEEAQGRGDSKMAFYQALQNSLGGEERNARVQDAAVWFYSLQHSTDDYASFSRALENSTRDHFIACPAVKMAKQWVENSKGDVFMYYVPEEFSRSSSGLDLPADVKYAFGLPFHSSYKYLFSAEEQNLSLKIMRYITNFIKTGNPNFQYTFSRKLSGDLPVWPEYRAHSDGDTYKEFSSALSNKQGLKKAECSFWNDYIPTLKSSTGSQSPGVTAGKKLE
uniref:Thyroglobulin n=1 Tax=Leptobrachium leishanense TaxID=445787 RepID=A0A8C5MZL6_9ANUR